MTVVVDILDLHTAMYIRTHIKVNSRGKSSGQGQRGKLMNTIKNLCT